MKESKYDIPIAIYGSIIHLIITTDVLLSKKKLCKKYKHLQDDGEDDSTAAAWFLPDHLNSGHYYIILEKTISINLLVHESTHACSKILDDHDVVYSKDNNESLAYLNGFVAEQIWKRY